MICPNCGSEIDENQKFCTNCGAEVKFNLLPKNDLWLKIAAASITFNFILLIGLGVLYFYNKSTRTITIQSDNMEQTCPECPDVYENEQSEFDTDKDGVISQFDLNQYQRKATDEFMKYYDEVVNRIKNANSENSEIVNYINLADDRFEKAADTFFPERNGDTLVHYGSSFPMIFSQFEQTFYEIELESYKHLMQATTMNDMSDEIKRLYE